MNAKPTSRPKPVDSFLVASNYYPQTPSLPQPRYLRSVKTSHVGEKVFEFPFVKDSWEDIRKTTAKELERAMEDMDTDEYDDTDVWEDEIVLQNRITVCDREEEYKTTESSPGCDHAGDSLNRCREVTKTHCVESHEAWGSSHIRYRDLSNIRKASRFLGGDDNVCFSTSGKEYCIDFVSDESAARAATLFVALKTINEGAVPQVLQKQIDLEHEKVKQAFQQESDKVAAFRKEEEQKQKEIAEKQRAILNKFRRGWNAASPAEREQLWNMIDRKEKGFQKNENSKETKPNFYDACEKTGEAQGNMDICVQYLEEKMKETGTIKSDCKGDASCIKTRVSELAKNPTILKSGWGEYFLVTAKEYWSRRLQPKTIQR